MKNILTVSGIRPDFIRMSKVFNRLDEDSNINHTLIHTGQHYDNLLSGVFFNDLNIRKPDYNLRVGKQTNTHYVQQGVLANSLISIIENDKLNPDLILFLGDSNSVLASIPLKKEGYVIGHIEAGMRSYDERMLEEINRKACDHVSSLLFVYHEDYKNNILKENISEDRIHVTGNTIIEPLRDIADFDYTGNKEHILLDIHRPENFKYEDRLRAIIDYGNYCCDRTNTPVKLLHFSRTLSYIKKFNIDPKETVFIEDIAKNLEPAKKLGMKTVWLINDEYWGKKDSDKDFIDLKIKNLSSFLKEINILQTA